ncbi:MAG: T9SS type A sorting domain-containing protein [Bacteroidia bacterium]|nr:T9SS type A sorting domain-containing protein [Bacteroidia bacterium]MCF8425127.1 T9SS type A sorting domain-containing protein [Bacteroidia bacterium]MCF8446652.1 T9SS type A sorting domain-containing protein [Bacteroidia bacterium]
MKRIAILLALLNISIHLTIGQTVPSNCTAADSVVNKYLPDAYRLTIRRAQRNNLTIKDSIQIPKEYRDTTLSALIAVYNATSLQARDTIFNIHTFPFPDLNTILVAADSNLNWMKNLRNGILPTGNQEVDSLMSAYWLKPGRYFDYNFQPYHYVVLKSDSQLNILPLTKLFLLLPNVYYSEQNSIIGDGPDIIDSIFADHIELLYSIGWGDCPAGCIYRRFWKFNVYWDCSVEFVNSYGSLLPITSVNEVKVKKLEIYPNPFTQNLFIDGINEEFNFSISNQLGQTIKSGRCLNQIEGLVELKSGLYFLTISNNNFHSTYKILKE